MTKSIEEQVKNIQEAKKAVSNLTAVAIGTYRIDDQWHVVRLAFNPKTGESRVEEVFQEGDKASTAERFKIEAAQWLPVFQENQ